MELKILTPSAKASRAGSRHLANDSLAICSTPALVSCGGLTCRLPPLYTTLAGVARTFWIILVISSLQSVKNLMHGYMVDQYDKAAGGSERDRGGMTA